MTKSTIGREMNKGLVKCVVLGMVCSVAIGTTAVGHTIAGTTKTKEPISVVVATKPLKRHSLQGQDSLTQRVKKSPVRPVRGRSEAMLSQAKPVPSQLKRKNFQNPRQKKGQPETTPEAVVPLKSGLTHHGMLETPQRYDPRRNQLGAGIPDPQTPELTHEHFQELDRNQDGTIDPLERAFGRPDMDRDLHSHRSR